jgi:membrane protease YdiL (CAAX protease family)
LDDNLKRIHAPLSSFHPLLFVALVLLVIFFLYQIVSAVLVISFVGVELNYDKENIDTIRIITMFAQFMFLLIPSVILTMLRGDTMKNGFRLNYPPGKILFISIAGILMLQPIMQAYLVIQNKILFSLPFGTEYIKMLKEFFDTLEQSTLNLVSSDNIPELILVVLVIAVTPAICEEGLFRGLVLKNMLLFSTPARAVATTGIIFAMFHFHPFNLLPLILVGIFLTYITYVSNSIFPAVICHFINNLLAVLSVFFYGKENFNDFNIPLNETLALSGIGVICAVCLYFLMKILSREHQMRNTNLPENMNVQ